MELTLSLPERTEARLRERAEAAGKSISVFVTELIDQFAQSPTPLETLSGPIYQRFVESGMTDEELGDELERAKHEMRQERKARHAS